MTGLLWVIGLAMASYVLICAIHQAVLTVGQIAFQQQEHGPRKQWATRAMEQEVEEAIEVLRAANQAAERTINALAPPSPPPPGCFGWALKQLKDGKKLARAGWNGKDMWIVLMPELKLPPYSSQEPGAKVNDRTARFIGPDTPLDSRPYIAMWTAKGQWQPGWLASQEDLLAEDWFVV